MPVYCYKCNKCNLEFEVRHSMSFEEQACTSCSSDDVFKIPSLGETKTSISVSTKPGKIVDEYIRDTAQEIKKEKQKLRTQEL
jgi:putative FmdB family regulatory protein